MNSKKTESIFDFCIKEMFLRVGEKYPNKDLTEHTDWYMMRSWTIGEEEQFRRWMVSFLRKKNKWTIKRAEYEASFFIMNYGWTNRYPLFIKGNKTKSGRKNGKAKISTNNKV
jgi:hypothetical protein